MSNQTEQNVDRDWEININLSGLTAPTGKGGSVLPEGYYKVKIVDMYVNPEKRTRVILKLSINDPEFVGMMRTTGMQIPTSLEDKVRYYWRGLAESAGYRPADLDNGELKLGPKSFIDREAHIRYTPKEEGNKEREYEQIDFLAPATWAQQKQAFSLRAGAPVTSASTATDMAIETGKPLDNGGLTNKADVMKALGLGA